MKNMPSVQNEVLYAMQPELAPTDAAPPARFGAKDEYLISVEDSVSMHVHCTSCGRRSAACSRRCMPGKLLSPRKIMMSTRDRLEEVARIST
jgi:hypothetical protein